jgi:dipeptidyl aminopeptidase/acylaminoacyl peptidase
MPLDQTPLISRRRLFGNPERGACRISPDGCWLAFSAPRDGVMNLWVCPRGDFAAARALTDDRKRGVSQFSWAYDNTHLLYAQDESGDENFHLHAVSIASGVARDLTPYPGVRGLLHAVSRKFRDEVLITLNRRDLRFADLYRVNVAGGQMSLVQHNPGMAGFITDDDFSVRLALAPQPDGGWMWLLPDGTKGWTAWQCIVAADAMTTHALQVGADGRTLYALDSRGRDTAALVAFDLAAATPTARLIAEHPRADVSELLTHAHSHAPLAYAVDVERREMHVLADSVRADVATLDAQNLGDWQLASRSDDDRLWVVRFSGDLNPVSYALFERDAQRVSKLYDCFPDLTDRAVAPLARMQPTTLTSRDGLALVSYLTLPVHADCTDQALTSSEPLPLVLLVHGGPWARDSFGYDPEHQWLANRGYAVLSVNFRASTGFGKAFVNAGDLEWGAKMDDDLCDAVDWAIARGIADPKRIAIMGGSYGGYATLWALTAHAERYACGVDIVGPSNLETLLASTPPQWEAMRAVLYRQLGHPDTAQGKALLKARSPLHRASAIRKPLLIGQGANDPRVKQAEADQMAAAMKANGIPVTYVLYPDEGHGFVRPANRLSFNAIAERFLAQYLGGRSEPASDDEIAGHTAVMVQDALR